MPYHVAALGDSVMWGQGLREGQKFYTLVAQAVANRLGEEGATPTVLARSGATLSWVTGKPETMRRDFADLYPEVFPDEEAARRFVEGQDELAALALPPELPASLPIVQAQIAALKGALPHVGNIKARLSPDLILLNGGANDVEFQVMLDPQEMTYDQMDTLFVNQIYLPLSINLQRVRAQFPNALIVVPGYYPVFSPRSSLDKLSAFVEWHTKYVGKDLGGFDAKEFLKSASGIAITALGLGTAPYAYVVGLLTAHGLSALWKKRGLRDAARDVIARALYAHSRSQHWMARAVRTMSAKLGGPGILFVSPRFEPEHGAFAGDPHVFEDYAEPGDPLALERLASYPRAGVYSQLVAAGKALAHFHDSPDDEERELEASRALRSLDRNRGFRGPRQLKDAVRILLEASNIENKYQRDVALAQLALELQRLGVAAGASVFHPNRKGALRYAEQITEAVMAYLRPDITLDLSRLGGQTQPELTLRRYGLAGLSDGDLTQMMRVDTIALETMSPLPPRHYIELSLPQAQPKLQRSFTTHGGRFFTLDLGGAVHLSELNRATIKVRWEPPPPPPPPPSGGFMQPPPPPKPEPSPLEKEPWDTGAVTLYINGLKIEDFARRYELKPNVEVRLRYGAIGPWM